MSRMNVVSVVMCLFIVAAFGITTGCSNTLMGSRVVRLGGKVSRVKGQVIEVDLSRGVYVPVCDSPGDGGVISRKQYFLESHRPKNIDDHRFLQIPLAATIREINLAGCDIGTDAIQHLVKSCPNLVSLNLSDTKISNKDLQLLSQLTQLQNLSLAGTPIDGRGVSHLMLLRQLKELNMVDTNLDAKALKRLLDLPQLQEIFVFHVPATFEDSAMAEKILSDSRVTTSNPFDSIIL